MAGPTIGLPFYYDEINNLRGHKVPSVGLCYDSETFFFFWRSLYQRLASKFEWQVPDHWDKEVFEFTLYSLGFVGVFDTNKYAATPNQRFGIIPAPSTVYGIGVQMQPTKIKTAKKLLKDNLPIEQIAKYTDLPLEKVQELTKEIEVIEK